MKNKLLIPIMVSLLVMTSVLAVTPTGFNFNKDVVVKGNWEWLGSWQLTYPETATYNYDVDSPLATESYVNNFDILGLPWKYVGRTQISVNKPAEFQNQLNVWTVNDPATTPATGGYTRFDFQEITQITNPSSASSVVINAFGYGQMNLISHIITDASTWQQTSVGINAI